MKTLSVVLCMLLVMIPARAQQIAERSAPHFYVPYAVSLSRPGANVGEPSADDAAPVEPVPFASAPRQRFPTRRPYPRFGPRYMGYAPPPGPPVSTRTALIIAGAVAGLITLYVVTAPH